MRVLLSTFGSRGDVEPLAALAVELRAIGVETLVSAPSDEEFVELLARADAPMAPAFAAVRPWARERRRDGPVHIPTVAAEMVAAQFEAIDAAADGCDAILATGLLPSTAAALAVAGRRRIPYLHVGFCPVFLPSPHHAPCAFPGHPHPPGVTDKLALWDRNAKTVADLFGGAVNAHRNSIGLPQLIAVRDRVLTDAPWLASDPTLLPWRETELGVVQTGAWILPDTRPLPTELTAFLEAGEPPVYVGFGSMGMDGSPDIARSAVSALRARGRRAVIARGWAGLSIGDEDDCIAVGDVNQQTLFGQVAAVVHHGGAGTTTAAARAGAPQVVVPQAADQPCWADRIAELGVGARHEGPTPTEGSLTAALEIALRPETHVRATELAPKISTDGAAIAARRLIETVRMRS